MKTINFLKFEITLTFKKVLSYVNLLTSRIDDHGTCKSYVRNTFMGEIDPLKAHQGPSQGGKGAKIWTSLNLV